MLHHHVVFTRLYAAATLPLHSHGSSSVCGTGVYNLSIVYSIILYMLCLDAIHMCYNYAHVLFCLLSVKNQVVSKNFFIILYFSWCGPPPKGDICVLMI